MWSQPYLCAAELNRATPEQEAAPLSSTIPQDGTGADKELLAAG